MRSGGNDLIVAAFIFVVSTASLRFGLGLEWWLAVVLGFVFACLSTLVLVVVFDGDGSPW